MTDDIVTRLREEVAKAEVAGVLPNWELAKCMWEAADEIERLRDQVAGYKFVVQLAIKLYETETPDAR